MPILLLVEFAVKHIYGYDTLLRSRRTIPCRWFERRNAL